MNLTITDKERILFYFLCKCDYHHWPRVSTQLIHRYNPPPIYKINTNKHEFELSKRILWIIFLKKISSPFWATKRDFD
jgi:hypothetical protein